MNFDGVSPAIAPVDSAGSGTVTYSINAADASIEVITITALFKHNDLVPDPIEFTVKGHINKISGDEAFTNAITDAHNGSGEISYTSSDSSVAVVDNSGRVAVLKPGSAIIKAEKAADVEFDSAQASYTLTVAQNLSMFFGYVWEKSSDDTTSFTYSFQPDGSISVHHCCGLEVPNQFCYFFQGNYFVTYGAEMGNAEIIVTSYTVSEDGLSFTRGNGQSFSRGEALYSSSHSHTSSSGSVLVLSNALLGSWKGDDGKVYVFGSDGGLRINSDQYGYLVRNNELLTLGPFVQGAMPVLQKYKYAKVAGKLYLQYTEDGKTYTITLSGL